MKKEYSSPILNVEYIFMEYSLATSSINMADESNEIKTEWEIGEEFNENIEI